EQPGRDLRGGRGSDVRAAGGRQGPVRHRHHAGDANVHTGERRRVPFQGCAQSLLYGHVDQASGDSPGLRGVLPVNDALERVGPVVPRGAGGAGTGVSTIPVYALLPPRLLLLDVAGPLEVLRRANELQDAVRFDVHYIGCAPSLCTSIGLTVAEIEP